MDNPEVIPRTEDDLRTGTTPIDEELNELNELERTLARIESEHRSEESMSWATKSSDLPTFRSIESLLYRVSKVFEDKRPIDEQGRAADRKTYIRQVERKRELGMQ